MKSKSVLSVLALGALWLHACQQGEEAQPLVTITSITPGPVTIGGSTLNTAVVGDTLLISGTGFSAVAAENLVSMQGISARVLASTASTLQALVPPGVPFSIVDVVVTRAGYQSASRQISVRSAPSPIITRIRPAQGRVGSAVTIYGRHLLETVSANRLAFADASGQEAAVFVQPINPLLATDDSIRITVPASAGTGRIALYARPVQSVANSFGSITTPVFTVIP
jgi:hypothetical protein